MTSLWYEDSEREYAFARMVDDLCMIAITRNNHHVATGNVHRRHLEYALHAMTDHKDRNRDDVSIFLQKSGWHSFTWSSKPKWTELCEVIERVLRERVEVKEGEPESARGDPAFAT